VEEIRLAAHKGYSIETIFAEVGDDGLAREFPRLYQPVSGEVLQRISYGQRERCPVAVVVQPKLELAGLKLTADSRLLVLDRIEKPGNLGACLRSAAATGADALLLSDPVCEVYNPNAIRASRGAVFSVPIAVCQASEARSFLQSLGVRVFAARVDAPRELWDCPLAGGTAIVFGSEAHGLGQDWSCEWITPFRIPMTNDTDSLNLSISAAVTMYERWRQTATMPS
jgi:TrmH family RNA methyltransferase